MRKNNKSCFSGNFCIDALGGKVIPLKDKRRNNSPAIGQDISITARHDMPVTPDNSLPHWHTPQSTASSILHIIFLPLPDDYWELFKIKAPWEEIWSRGQYVSAEDGGIDFIWEHFKERSIWSTWSTSGVWCVIWDHILCIWKHSMLENTFTSDITLMLLSHPLAFCSCST